MKKSEFKKVIKPIVSECIRESLMEDGLISGIISEVVKGMHSAPPPVTPTPLSHSEPEPDRMKRNAFEPKRTSQLQEHRKKLMAAIGREAYNGINLFEGTTPMASQASPQQQAAPLSGQEPSDPGVDISSIMGAVGSHWNAHMTEVKKERK